jgi:hypothetical protein
MNEDQLRGLMRAEAARVGAQAPAANTAAAWHAARRARAMRLHHLFNLAGWGIRAGVAGLLGVTMWVDPGALPAAALPSLLLLWLSGGIVRRAPEPADRQPLTSR